MTEHVELSAVAKFTQRIQMTTEDYSRFGEEFNKVAAALTRSAGVALHEASRMINTALQSEPPTKENPMKSLLDQINDTRATPAGQTKVPNTRANRRAYLTARNHGAGHGVFHRPMTAARKRCVKCAGKIASYRTLCYQCEVNILLAELARIEAKKTAGISRPRRQA